MSIIDSRHTATLSRFLQQTTHGVGETHRAKLEDLEAKTLRWTIMAVAIAGVSTRVAEQHFAKIAWDESAAVSAWAAVAAGVIGTAAMALGASRASLHLGEERKLLQEPCGHKRRMWALAGAVAGFSAVMLMTR